ncbi:MAG: DUF4920 domain-containing protein [Cytophagales bacterium]|nr:DUF4920 domain-containing protein [Bernardetiaceae bacterium]MDW8209601.1 DUF4920 domain-containing protein [Cytophagales bacterium]
MNNFRLVLLAFIFAIKSTFSAFSQEFSYYGEKITEEGAIPASQLLELMKDTNEGTFKVKGTILQTCTKKGCWMSIDLGQGRSMIVRFKDYGFFVPKSGVEGLEAIFEGVARKQIRSVEELRHYAHDAGKSKEEIAQITQPRQEIIFEASGVIIKGYKRKE